MLHRQEAAGSNPAPPTIQMRAEVAEWQTRCVQGAVSERACGFKSHLRHQTTQGARAAPISRARSSVRIERSPAEAEVVGSRPTERAITFPKAPANAITPAPPPC